MYDLGLIGNCQVSALIKRDGKMTWLCLPRPDGEPMFGQLLDPDGGFWSFELEHGNTQIVQYYETNTNILVTEVGDENGNGIRITDFCPRFYQYGRIYRPIMVIRTVERISGDPHLKVDFSPIAGWSKQPAQAVRGNSHVRYAFGNQVARLATNLSLTQLLEKKSVVVTEKLYFVLTLGLGIEDELDTVCEDFLRRTRLYWLTWVKHGRVPSLFQPEVIRSALCLKLHCYEETGAILAATTTSLPEERGGVRNWDYRFCWLRDASYVLSAFIHLGHFEEIDGFIKYFLNIASHHRGTDQQLWPVFNADADLPLPELELSNWAGFENSKPVRVCNQAAEHVQNDVYGELILTLAPIFFDDRFFSVRSAEKEKMMEVLAEKCRDSIGTKDAGLWEVRHGWQEHSFTNLMCWAGLERIERIHKLGFLKGITWDISAAREKAEHAVRRGITDGYLANGPTDATLDASLAQAAMLRFPDAEMIQQTIKKIREGLKLGNSDFDSSFFYRYRRQDDFGTPASAFVICSFWVIQALARMGNCEDGQKMMKNVLKSGNHLGLLAEHFDPAHATQLGNFPQAYSHVGVINAAFAISPSWSDVL